MGLIAAIELVADKASHTNFDPALKVGPRFVKLVEANGVIGRGLPNDSLAFSPPLIITAEEIDAILDRVATALDELYGQLRQEGVVA